MVEAARDLTCRSCRHVNGFGRSNADNIAPVGESKARYYLRLTLLDKPGMFGQVGTLLGKHAVSIASVLQKENCTGKHVPIIIITHHAQESDFRAALKELDAMPGAGAKAVCIRIEDF